jgi:hypothetical protein
VNNSKNGLGSFYAIVAIYIIFPFLYYYGVHLRDDYIFINAFDSITNILWAIIGVISVFSVLRSFQFLAKNKITSKIAFLKYPLLSLALFALFWVYSFLPTYIDYGLN